MNKGISAIPVVVTLCVLSGCASTGDLVSVPEVTLRNVAAEDLGITGQTFVLAFEVDNPNPFPLPIKSVSYGLELDGYRFATGSTPASITVPAAGGSDFAITVELNLMRTAPQLLHVVRDGLKNDIPYELNGEFGLDIPLVESVSFRHAGAVRLQEIGRQALKSQ